MFSPFSSEMSGWFMMTLMIIIMMTILSSLRLTRFCIKCKIQAAYICLGVQSCSWQCVSVFLSNVCLASGWVGGGRDKRGFWCGAAISNPRALLLLGSSFIWAIWCKHNNGRIRSSWFSATFHMKQMDHWPLDPIKCHFECLYNGAVVCKMKRISN